MNHPPGSTFLTGAEIAELTGIRTGKNGRTREQLQIEQLARIAIPHYVNAASQIYACLRHGVIDEPGHLNIRGNWKCTLRHIHAGDEVKVVTVIERDENGDWIAVVTVF